MTEPNKNIQQNQPIQPEKKEVQESEKRETPAEEFNPYKVAIDVYNNKYGLYANERIELLMGEGYTEKQAVEILSIVPTIQG